MKREVAGALLLALTAGGVVGLAPSSAVAAPVPALTVDVGRYTTETNPTQWGHIIEDISHSVEGGLNANIVRNSNMKEGGTNPPAYWSAFTAGGGSGSIALDTTNPLNAANQNSLRLDIAANARGQRVGVANSGFYGVAIKARTTYTATFWARAQGVGGPLTVALQSASGTVYAQARTSAVTGDWAEYTVSLTTRNAVPSGQDNRVVISADGRGAGGSLWVNVVRMLPPTYGTSDLLRTDLMTKLAGIEPGFWRVPGGNYLEGNTLETYFQWKETIGPVETRPGHQNDAWGYWSTDQAGIKDYLDMADQTDSQAVLAVFAGYVLNGYQNGGTPVPADELQPYIDDALDEIEYAIGDVSTEWGAQRAADGHPEPYDVRYVEIGNEDFFDSRGTYDAYRFPMFYDAIKAEYPQLELIATQPVTSRVPDVVDEHYYNTNPAVFTGMADMYDDYDRNGPKILVGEYGITNGTPGNPTGTLSGAIGEAGYMTGMLENADVVIGASYAPALAHVRDYQWPINLVGFDAATSYVSPSYYVQQMFGANKGDYVLPTTFSGVASDINYVATRGADGKVYVHVVNPSGSTITARINVTGADTVSGPGSQTQLTGDPNARNTITTPNTIRPRTSAFTPSSSFARTFPANSVTVLTLSVTGDLVPVLDTDESGSLRVTTPGFDDRSVAVDASGLGITNVVTASSSGPDKKNATFFTRVGLADAGCYSFESRSNPGQYLRHQAFEVKLGTPDGTTGFNEDATFCATEGNSGTGISLRSKNFPDRFLRHFANRLYVASNGGPLFFDAPGGWAQDTTFEQAGPWWRSDVDVTLGSHSYQATTPGFTDNFLRHRAFVGQISPLSPSSPLSDRQDATFVLVPGLADNSCYSFQSLNFPDRYLRHYNFAVRLDAPDGSAAYNSDATFCAQPGNSGQAGTTSWQASGFPAKYLRHYGGDVFVASNGGGNVFDSPSNWAVDSSWITTGPLA